MDADDAMRPAATTPPGRRSRAERIRIIGIWVGGGLIVGAAIALQLYLWGPAVELWDWLLVSGLVVFIFALASFAGLGMDVRDTLRRLRDRGIVREHARASIDTVMDSLKQRGRWLRPVCAAVLAVLMGLIWLYLVGWSVAAYPIFWVQVVLAAVAGDAVGGMIAYGGLGSVLRRLGLEPRPQPGHVDGAGGLQPVGALFLRQAMIVAAIILFAGVWWLLIPSFPRYDRWREPYVVVIIIGLTIELAVFLAPLVSFHRVMRRARDAFRLEADRVAVELSALRGKRDRSDTPAEVDGIEAAIGVLSTRWTELETMPTWPIDSRIRRRFTVGNALAFAPVVFKALASAPWWGPLVSVVS